MTDFNSTHYYTKLEIDELNEFVYDVIDKLWLIISMGFIFLMQMGFTMLESGSVR